MVQNYANISYQLAVIEHLVDMHKWTVVHCRLCNRKFLDKTELDQHLSDDHSTVIHFPCVQCGTIFDSHDHLDSHISSTHATMPKKVECSICGQKFHLQNVAKTCPNYILQTKSAQLHISRFADVRAKPL
ncbi:Zinc finger and BTB domain-containing protein 16 [Folsomia candida]|uniref:Zinc finger and BTB domain-containing protein 16 n=1 Tax=Folsomia candida TaxID=158441 RepID=A0A226DCM1_FOLCA|nr:Zinc finger and BTB domain-containing protein 16 [Folsomia candida]